MKINKANIQPKKGETVITYKNSEGETVTFSAKKKKCVDVGVMYKDLNKAAESIFGAVNKYQTEEDPNITPEEQVKLRADIAKENVPATSRGGDQSVVNTLDVCGGVDFVLKTFSDPASEGGKNITQNEIAQMYEIFHKWTDPKD